jgi:glycine cleavage system regulatory protein
VAAPQSCPKCFLRSRRGCRRARLRQCRAIVRLVATRAALPPAGRMSYRVRSPLKIISACQALPSIPRGGGGTVRGVVQAGLWRPCMKTSLTLIGSDCPGLMSAVAACASAHGASWMERWAVTSPALSVSRWSRARSTGSSARCPGWTEGLQMAFARAAEAPVAVPRGARLERGGHDRPGIVRDISAVLARHGVSIDALETACENASMSDEPLFGARRTRRGWRHGSRRCAQRRRGARQRVMVDLTLAEVPETRE